MDEDGIRGLISHPSVSVRHEDEGIQQFCVLADFPARSNNKPVLLPMSLILIRLTTVPKLTIRIGRTPIIRKLFSG